MDTMPGVEYSGIILLVLHCTTVQSVPDKLANLVNLGLPPNLDLAYAEGEKKLKTWTSPHLVPNG